MSESSHAEPTAVAEARLRDSCIALGKRVRRLRLWLAATALLLVLACGVGAWLVQKQRAEAAARRREADRLARQAVERGRELLRHGWENNDRRLLDDARAEAAKAADLARSGDASPEVREETEALQQEVQSKLEEWEKNDRLLKALLDVAAPRETGRFAQGKDGVMVALAEPSADEQFAAAFRRWGLDVDRDPPEEVVQRLQSQPRPTMDEVVAALDAWILERQKQSKNAEECRRLLRLAKRLDANEQRRQVRELLASGQLRRERVAGELSAVLLPWSGPFGPARGAGQRRLRELAAGLDQAREPVLTVLLLARALDLAGDATEAERLLRRAIAGRPGEVVLLTELGKLLEGQGRWAESVGCYRAARALRPGLGVALARTLYQAGGPAEAEAVLRELTDREPRNPELWFQLGNALHDQNKLAEAKAAFSRVIALKPDDPQAHYNLGHTLVNQKKYAEAVAAYRKAITLKPDYAPAYNGLGNALAGQKKLDEAVAAYRRAIALQPDLAEAYNGLGAALRGLKRPAEAEASFRKAIALRPTFAEAYHNMGKVLRDQKRLNEAVASFRQAIRLKPNHAEAYNDLGTVLYEQKKLVEAEAAFRRAIELQPKFAQAYTNLGNALLAQKKTKEAEAAFRKAAALKADPTKPPPGPKPPSP